MLLANLTCFVNPLKRYNAFFVLTLRSLCRYVANNLCFFVSLSVHRNVYYIGKRTDSGVSSAPWERCFSRASTSSRWTRLASWTRLPRSTWNETRSFLEHEGAANALLSFASSFSADVNLLYARRYVNSDLEVSTWWKWSRGNLVKMRTVGPN